MDSFFAPTAMVNCQAVIVGMSLFGILPSDHWTLHISLTVVQVQLGHYCVCHITVAF
jgi:hypothetical protein